jgi:hypothetical protein
LLRVFTADFSASLHGFNKPQAPMRRPGTAARQAVNEDREETLPLTRFGQGAGEDAHRRNC